MTDSKKRSPPDAHARMEQVGYGKPPTHGQFKKGVSGNPRGRPPGSGRPSETSEYMAAVAALFGEPVSAVQDGVHRKISLIEAMHATLIRKACAGDINFLKLMSKRKTVDHRAAKVIEAADKQQPAGVLIVPYAPNSIEEWVELYGEMAKGTYRSDISAWPLHVQQACEELNRPLLAAGKESRHGKV